MKRFGREPARSHRVSVNFFPGLDVSVFETLDQFEAVIKRDFEEKAHTEVEIIGPRRDWHLSQQLRASTGCCDESVLGASLCDDAIRQAADALA